jgi:esterase/lipase
MEDVMGEYFIRTIWKREPKAHKAYLQYIDHTIKYISDYKKLTDKSESHIKKVANRVQDALETNSSPLKQKYFEHMQMVLKCLKQRPILPLLF